MAAAWTDAFGGAWSDYWGTEEPIVVVPQLGGGLLVASHMRNSLRRLKDHEEEIVIVNLLQ